jgi:multiple sugar transport system permease protein
MLKKYDKIGYIFTLPYILHVLVFTTFPLVFSFLLVFHRWDIISPMEWVGVTNFIKLSKDQLFFTSVVNTLKFLIIHIPLQIGIALLLAEFLNQKIRFRGFFRASYFLPVIVSGVVITILWQQLYAQDMGVINSLLVKLGLHKVPWLTNIELAMPSIAIMATWKNVGLYIVLFLVGLQSIPNYMYEAADIEGASHWQKFRHITLPMINPTIVMVVILSTIGGFSLFIEPYIMTDGGPLNSTLSAMLYIYRQAFSFYHMGYAATLGFFFALVVFSIIIIQKKVIEKESNY